LGIAAAAGAVIAAPYLSADAFGGRIRQALERELHRPVEIQAARFNLLRGPGFTLLGVVIHDDPEGAGEPFAYVTSIESRVSLMALVAGRLEFSSLRLEEPSLNLVKTPAGAWNFQTLLGGSRERRLPAVSVRGGRLNFTLNGVKSVFYFSQADLDIEPPRGPGGAFEFDFAGDPTRSDRAARGFGRVRGRGRWRPAAGASAALDLELLLERTSLGELATLIYGYDIGVHGQVSGRAALRGALDALAIDGTLDLTDLHRWDLLPPYAEGGPVRLRGRLNLPGQELDIETAPDPRSAVGFRLRATGYLGQPRWVAGATLNGFPLEPVADVGRHMGLPLAENDRLKGTLTGAVAYSPADGFRGSLLAAEVSLEQAGRPAMQAREARLVLDGDHVTLAAGPASFGGQGRAALKLDYWIGRRRMELRLEAERLEAAALAGGSGPLPGAPPPAFAAWFREGVWSGRLVYRRDGVAPGAWIGTMRLDEAAASLEGFAEPVRIAHAEVAVQGEQVRVSDVEAAAGGLEIRGEYVRQPAARRPDQVAIRIPRATLGEVERLLGPALRRPRGLLSRTLRLERGTVPEWLGARRAQGTLEIGALETAGVTAESVRLSFYWDGAAVDVPRYAARVAGGELEGYFTVNLGGAEASLRLSGRLENGNWRGGRLSADGTLTASGSGEAFYRSLRSEGTFRVQNAAVGAGAQFPLAAGTWALSWEKTAPRVQLSGVRVVDDDGVYTGHGGSAGADKLELELSRGERRLRLAGTLKPLELVRAGER
jgi:hypothetical protein